MVVLGKSSPQHKAWVLAVGEEEAKSTQASAEGQCGWGVVGAYREGRSHGHGSW